MQCVAAGCSFNVTLEKLKTKKSGLGASAWKPKNLLLLFFRSTNRKRSLIISLDTRPRCLRDVITTPMTAIALNKSTAAFRARQASGFKGRGIDFDSSGQSGQRRDLARVKALRLNSLWRFVPESCQISFVTPSQKRHKGVFYTLRRSIWLSIDGICQRGEGGSPLVAGALALKAKIS